MGMSTHVIGFRPPDERWRQMKAVWDTATLAGVEIPDEVVRFFGDEEPDPAGLEIELPLAEWGDDSREGYELQVADIPDGVTVIRFYNSW